MNFLNKKHIQSFANNTQNSSKGFAPAEESNFIPNGGSYISSKPQLNRGIQMKQSPKVMYHQVNSPSSITKQKEAPHYSSTYTQNFAQKTSMSSTSTFLQCNICPQHQNELLRHLCLQCNHLLCSECISDHLSDHRQNTKTIPKIETINKLRKQMNVKAQKILHFMEENSPKVILNDISQLKYEAITKIQQMKSQVVRAFDEWCKLLQKHIVDDLIKEDELSTLSNEMNKLRDEVGGLYNQMIGQRDVNAEVVKKLNQVDSEKLQAAYLLMFNKFSKSVLKSKFTFEFDWKNLMQGFDKSIVLKPLHPHVFAQEDKIQEVDQDTDRQQVKSSIDHHPILQKRMSGNDEKRKSLVHNNNEQGMSDHQGEQKKFMLIQSIESLVDPLQALVRQESHAVFKISSQQRLQGGQKVERSYSREGSVKRLAIFPGPPDQNSGQNQRLSQSQSQAVQE